MTLILAGTEKDLGDRFYIKRILPSLEKRSIGPFVFFDHFGPKSMERGDEMVVRAHPHIGLATITYLYSGLVHHRDSLGVSKVIRPFETNWMVAGSGIAHSERSERDPDSDQLEGIQTWIALPKSHEDIEPSFQHISSEQNPILQEQGYTMRLLGGSFLQMISPAKIYSPLFYADVETTEENSNIKWKLPPNQEAGLYVSKGAIEVSGKRLDVGQMAVFETGTSVEFTSLERSRLILLGGEPFPEKRILWWNFVSTDLDKINRAKEIWAKDTFPKVPGEVDRIPLPPN
jgi:redox-sensitive bicupin YhaK (pirin superfamily)